MEKEAIKESMYLSVELWQASGLSQRAWCKQEGLARGKFEYWLDKYRKEHHSPVGAPAAFTRLETGNTGSVPGFLISYPNGARLHCPEGLGHGELLSLLCLMG